MDAKIPLVDLQLQYEPIASHVRIGWARVIERAAYVQGEEIARFEQAFAEFCGVRHCLGVANGTDALELVLRAAGVGPGDEVILPTNSFVASAAAVLRAGAVPVLVDVDPAYLLIDPRCVDEAVTPRTKAIMAVHLFGQMAPMGLLSDIAGTRICLIEDAAQAHGATHKGIGAGNAGLAAGTSFYPGKNLGAFGDAGAVLTNDDEVAWRIRALRNHGSLSKYEHVELGFNSRMDTLQAVVLSAKLPHLTAWNEARRAAASLYQELLGDLLDVRLPEVHRANEHVWHLYVVRVPGRNGVLRKLRAEGIGAGIHYPVPIHLQPAFRFLGYGSGDFPVAELACEEILSLPIFPGINPTQQERVVERLAEALP